ncbi:hypothetical protein AU468_06965 [Alkalispirochaeta sphaeroplastigenens]|uniref:Uncharacterized protein n=1 Tax=Alkalispirochaeta sphaeroplastigenens TaxID=1187066 RepID=A0A2S4JR23_9SPIO|nr:hypothetical protein AU468_06965 [Alkalispirochaeta sphaeroplastigenens]
MACPGACPVRAGLPGAWLIQGYIALPGRGGPAGFGSLLFLIPLSCSLQISVLCFFSFPIVPSLCEL